MIMTSSYLKLQDITS